MDRGVRGEREREEKMILERETSLQDLRKLDRRFSLEQKEKLVYATRATHGHQKLSVSLNFTR